MCIRDSFDLRGIDILAAGDEQIFLAPHDEEIPLGIVARQVAGVKPTFDIQRGRACLLYTSDAADERSSVDLGGRRIIKKKQDKKKNTRTQISNIKEESRERSIRYHKQCGS